MLPTASLGRPNTASVGQNKVLVCKPDCDVVCKNVPVINRDGGWINKMINWSIVDI